MLLTTEGSEMVPQPTDRLSEATRRGVADREGDAAGEIALIRGDGADPPPVAAGGNVHRAERHDVAREKGRDHGRRRRRGAPARQRSRRLGPVEYTLLALIALGIVVTITMAVLNPSG